MRGQRVVHLDACVDALLSPSSRSTACLVASKIARSQLALREPQAHN